MMTNKCTATIDIMEPPIKTVVLYPDKDAVILEAEPWVNYGESTLMELTNSLTTKAATIMNFSGISAIKGKVWENLIDINLQFVTQGYRTEGHTLDMYRYNDDSWQEIFVSWNNAPQKQSKIQTLDIPAEKDTYQIDITDLITKERRNDDNIGFYFSSRDKAQKRIISMYSKESSHKPCIVFRYYDIPGAPFLKSLPGKVNVAALLFTPKRNAYRPGNGEITGTVNLKTDYEYKDITGDLYVPKFVAVHEVFKDKDDVIIGENSPADSPTEVKNQFWRDWTEASADWDVEINGTVRTARKGPAAWISGEVTPWFGSAFKNTYFDVSKAVMYSGIERLDIKAMEDKFISTPDIFSETDSEGDLITGTVELQGREQAEFYGDITVALPVLEMPEIIGKLSSSISVDEKDMPVIDCPGTIVYKKDENDKDVIDEEQSCYLKVDGHVDGPKLAGKLTVPKFFAVGTRYYKKEEVIPEPPTTEEGESEEGKEETKPEETQQPAEPTIVDTLVHEEKIGDDSTEKYTGPFDFLDADAQIDGKISSQGKYTTELKGRLTVIYEVEPNPELPGEIKVSSIVFPVTVNPENGETTSQGDLITGTLDFMAGEFETINGKVHVAVHYDAFELDGNLDTAVEIDSDSLPTISCPINNNIVFKKDADGKDLPIVDEEATGDYLLIFAQTNEITVTEDGKHEGKHDITGTVRVSHKSAFAWTFTKPDGTSETVDSTDEIEDLCTDYESDHKKYSDISSTGDLLTGDLHVMALGRAEMVTPSDNVVFTKNKDGDDTIHVDESKSGDYLFVIAICGATTAYDKDGNRIKDYDIYNEDGKLDHTDFDKPSQEIRGKVRIAAKITTWIDGTIRCVSEKEEEVTGDVKVLPLKRIELDGQIDVDAKPPQGSYAFII